MKKIVVPDGMRKAALKAIESANAVELGVEGGAKIVLEAAFRWLSENPIVPTEKQEKEMDQWARARMAREPIRPATFAVEWQRRMFLAPEPEVPEAIKDMQRIHYASLSGQEDLDSNLQKLLIEAYNRGLKEPK